MSYYLWWIILICTVVCKCYGEVKDNIVLSEDKNSTLPTTQPKITTIDGIENFSIEQLRNDTLLSYLDEDYESCVELFETTRQRYRTYKQETVKCRRKCKTDSQKAKSMFQHHVGEIAFYEKKIKETLCLIKCKNSYEKLHGKGSLTILPPDLELQFTDLRDYLVAHICYYQMKRYKDAANAIYTYIVMHPDDQLSWRYLDHYLTSSEVSKETLEDLEAAPFVKIYKEAIEDYEEGHFSNSVWKFEESLEMYLQNDEDCRLYCEGAFDPGWHPELTIEIANHFTYCLQCKQNCTKWLNTINGKQLSDTLAHHYHYLQFAYYKTGQLANACAAVESYLLFHPADEVMLNNKKYYAAMPKFQKEDDTPRQEAIEFLKRQTSEAALLQFIYEEFTTEDEIDNDVENVIESDKSEKELSYITKSLKYLISKTAENSTDNSMGANNIEDNIKVIAAENDLGGNLRYVAEGFLSRKECEIIIKMAQIAVVEGDGYMNNKSPHSQFEQFEGTTIGRLALLAYFGIVDAESVELLMNVTETIQFHVKKYFNISDPLYFTYTHLTKRTPLSDSPRDRQDLSHKIHADNCVLSKKGCLRRYPAYVWRDYSAILYLNDNIVGGEFIFTNDRSTKTIEASVNPQCGRMVAFTADEQNLHGVRAVSQGSRFAVAMWFTLENKYLEFERVLARAILQRIRTYGVVQRNKIENISTAYEEMLTSLFYNDTMLQKLLKDL